MLFQKKCAAFVKLTVFALGLLTFAACKKDPKLSNLAGFLEFKIKDLNVTFTIDETAQKIQNTDSLPFGTDVSSLVAEFITVPNATVKIGNTPQVSGTTANDFSQPLTYVVVAQDGVTSRQYTVQVNVEKVDPKTVAWQRLVTDFGASYHNTRTIFFNNKFWTLGATVSSSDITFGTWSSTDGINWTRHEAADNNGDSIPKVESGALVTYQDKLWLIGGIRPGEQLPEGGTTFSEVVNKVWYTSDGVNWTASEPGASERWSPRERTNVVVFNNKLWLIGGNGYPYGGNTNAFGTAFRDVWSSSDGTNWTKETDAAAFPARTEPAVFVHDNKIWLAGGRAGATYLNDIWTSTDGVNWTEVTVNTPFTGRLGHKIVAYDNQLFLVGGENATDGVLGDCWISEDNGVNWTKLEPGDVRALPGAFVPRVFHSMFVRDNAIWIAGGLSTKDANNVYTQLSDLWKGNLVK
jgi:hypothetical protein